MNSLCCNLNPKSNNIADLIHHVQTVCTRCGRTHNLIFHIFSAFVLIFLELCEEKCHLLHVETHEGIM